MSEPEKTVEVEAADSKSDMASSPVTAEDTTITSVIDETSVHVDTMDSDSVVTDSSEINDRLPAQRAAWLRSIRIRKTKRKPELR